MHGGFSACAIASVAAIAGCLSRPSASGGASDGSGGNIDGSGSAGGGDSGRVVQVCPGGMELLVLSGSGIGCPSGATQTGMGSVTFSPTGVTLAPMAGQTATCTWNAPIGASVVLEVLNVEPGDASSSFQLDVANVDLKATSPSSTQYVLTFEQNGTQVASPLQASASNALYWELLTGNPQMVGAAISGDDVHFSQFPGNANVGNLGTAIAVSASCQTACSTGAAKIASLQLCP